MEIPPPQKRHLSIPNGLGECPYRFLLSNKQNNTLHPLFPNQIAHLALHCQVIIYGGGFYPCLPDEDHISF